MSPPPSPISTPFPRLIHGEKLKAIVRRVFERSVSIRHEFEFDPIPCWVDRSIGKERNVLTRRLPPIRNEFHACTSSARVSEFRECNEQKRGKRWTGIAGGTGWTNGNYACTEGGVDSKSPRPGNEYFEARVTDPDQRDTSHRRYERDN